MSRPRPHPLMIAIVGAGFSGTMAAIHAARLARSPITILLIEQCGVFAAGAAYGTHCPHHLLNVPAGNMSALPDQPNHFLEWLQANGHPATGGAFAPRETYRQYLQSLLQSTIERLRPEVALECVVGRVVDLERHDGRFALAMHDGAEVNADAVVLAPGNFAPADHSRIGADVRASRRYVGDPWRARGIRPISQGDSVLFIGTGLTMVDLVLELDHRGHSGPMIAISRRGLLHRPHRAEGHQHPMRNALELRSVPRDARSLVREVRSEIRKAAQTGHSWHDVVAALRPVSASIWRETPLAERARFLRHLRPLWDVHRHRLPPEAASRLAALQANGRLRVLAGHIESSSLHDEQITVQVRERRTQKRVTISAEHVINCMGPNRDVQRCGNELLLNLHRRGQVLPDPLGLGIQTDGAGRLRDSANQPQRGIHLVGPLRQGDLWEAVAVPELRWHAQQTVMALLADLNA